MGNATPVLWDPFSCDCDSFSTRTADTRSQYQIFTIRPDRLTREELLNSVKRSRPGQAQSQPEPPGASAGQSQRSSEPEPEPEPALPEKENCPNTTSFAHSPSCLTDSLTHL